MGSGMCIGVGSGRGRDWPRGHSHRQCYPDVTNTSSHATGSLSEAFGFAGAAGASGSGSGSGVAGTGRAAILTDNVTRTSRTRALMPLARCRKPLASRGPLVPLVLALLRA